MSRSPPAGTGGPDYLSTPVVNGPRSLASGYAVAYRTGTWYATAVSGPRQSARPGHAVADPLETRPRKDDAFVISAWAMLEPKVSPIGAVVSKGNTTVS